MRTYRTIVIKPRGNKLLTHCGIALQRRVFSHFSADAALNEPIPESLGNFFQNLKIKDHYYLKTELDLTFWYEYCCLKNAIIDGNSKRKPNRSFLKSFNIKFRIKSVLPPPQMGAGTIFERSHALGREII
jgi:hypothetical protein